MILETSIVRKVLDLAVKVQQIPAPTFEERERSAAIARWFRGEGLGKVEIDDLGNVFGCLVGNDHAPPVVVSAHLDTVFADKSTPEVQIGETQIHGPGIGDNAVGVASLFGLLWALKSGPTVLPGDLWLVANVGEEGLGNLRGMRAVVERFGNAPIGYIVLEGLAFGQIYHKALASERYRIHVRTAGGHSWVDYGKPSAVHELVRLTTEVLALQVPVEPRTTVNAGIIQGGRSINTIAPQAYVELDLRSEDMGVLKKLGDRMVQVCDRRRSADVQIEVELIGKRPGGALDHRHPLVDLALQCLRKQGVRPQLNIGSTDANIPLSAGIPAVCIGITTGGGAHTVDEYINTGPVSKGLEQLFALITGAYRLA